MLKQLPVLPLTEQYAKELRNLLESYAAIDYAPSPEAEIVEEKLLDLVQRAQVAYLQNKRIPRRELIGILKQIPDTKQGRQLRDRLQEERLSRQGGR